MGTLGVSRNNRYAKRLIPLRCHCEGCRRTRREGRPCVDSGSYTVFGIDLLMRLWLDGDVPENYTISKYVRCPLDVEFGETFIDVADGTMFTVAAAEINGVSIRITTSAGERFTYGGLYRGLRKVHIDPSEATS